MKSWNTVMPTALARTVTEAPHRAQSDVGQRSRRRQLMLSRLIGLGCLTLAASSAASQWSGATAPQKVALAAPEKTAPIATEKTAPIATGKTAPIATDKSPSVATEKKIAPVAPRKSTSVATEKRTAPLPSEKTTAPAPEKTAPATAQRTAPAAPLARLRETFREPLPDPSVGSRATATRYATLSAAQCTKELRERKLPVERAGTRRGIATALRLTGPLNGVTFLTAGRNSPFSVLDCRLVLVLDDLSKVLSAHSISQVRVDNFYRPGARLPRSRKRSQHAHGLAMDVTELLTNKGQRLHVESAWGASLGQEACGPNATLSDGSPETLALRNLICELGRSGLFHHILTPCHDRAHRNHLHFDIRRDARRISLD